MLYMLNGEPDSFGTGMKYFIELKTATTALSNAG
jgi:hypothetical protein